ncbi:MAG: glucose 1-dehydrogenase [Pirellulaceae bacterium]|nr:glucose 1-dehydrogenase [Pirellulaceae bacterium]
MADPPVAFITGAARGIGAATARELANRGYRLALVDLLAESLADVADDCRRRGVEVLICPCDLADLDAAQAAISRTVRQFGRLDVLVNNAAWRQVQTLRETDLATWEKTLRISLTAPAFLAKWSAEAMERQGSGVIINISSIRSEQCDGQAAAYVAVKGALDALTYELAALYGPRGIRVVAVRPGAIDTQLSADLGPPDALRELIADCLDHTPLGRFGRPEEIARAIAWLAGDDASFVTGTTLVVDGGLLHNAYGLRVKRQTKPGQF